MINISAQPMVLNTPGPAVAVREYPAATLLTVAHALHQLGTVVDGGRDP